MEMGGRKSMFAARKTNKLLIKAVVALSLMLPPLGLGPVTGQVHAEGPTDPAPFINARVVNENAGKKVLFDNTHGQTAGAADWVIDGAFSDFANAIADRGYYVKELRKAAPITLDDLKEYDVFVIGEANIPYKKSEQDAMLQYVQGGGSIFFIADHYNADRNKNRWDSSEVMNGFRRGAWEEPTKGMTAQEIASEAMQGVESSDWLSANFGVRFRYNALGDVTANQIVSPQQALGITEGVSEVAMHAGSTVAITDPNRAKGIVYLPATNEAWPNAVDQGVYNGGGVSEGPYVAVSKTGAGKAAFIGDSSPVEDATPKYVREENGQPKTTYDGFKEKDDGKLLVNMIDWLSKKESYTSLAQVPGLQLDQPTALLPMEQPAASTEPKAEPWSAPAPGYLWYDRSTFKPGSYGGPSIEYNPVYSFVKQSQLPNAQEFQIRVAADNMAPLSTKSGFSLGIYLTGGTQVAMVQNADGSWPTAYGYSSTFALTANEKGHAIKDLTIRVKPGTSGSANLRLRLNGSALKTETVTLANVPAEPLPPDTNGEPAKISVANARMKSEGTTVHIEGVVTTKPGIYGSQAFYLQDETAGIYVFQTLSGFNEGDKLKIVAPLALFNGELELTTPESIKKLGTSEVPAKKVVTQVDASNQGQLVELQQVKIQNLVSAAPSGSFEFDAVQGAVTNRIRVDARTGLTLSSFPYQEGQVVTVGGAASIFRGVYQLKPRGLRDFQLVDTTAPVTSYQLSAEPNAQGWYQQPVTLTLKGTDASGEVETKVRVNEQAWTAYTGPVTVDQQGVNKVEFYSKDAAGNQEAVQALQLRLDSVAPAASVTLNGAPVSTSAVLLSGETAVIHLSSADQVSGVAAQKLLLDGKDISSGVAVPASLLSLGTHTVSYVVADAAGNQTAGSFTLLVDTNLAVFEAWIKKLGEQGSFKNKGAQTALEAKLQQVQSHLSKGNTEQAVKHLQDVLETVEQDEQKGSLTAEAAAILKQQLRYLLDNGTK
jgi:DNA/RNA endonuclease YhcR with UshA esterase domain